MQHLNSWGVIGENFPNINTEMFDAKAYDCRKPVEENLAAVKKATKRIEDGLEKESDKERLRQKLISDFHEKIDKNSRIKMEEVKLELK